MFRSAQHDSSGNSRLKEAQLYGIIDLGYVNECDMLSVAAQMMEGGVDLLQLRAKNLGASQIEKLAAELHRVTSAAKVPLVINDHPEIAGAIGAEGVHLGQDDLSIEKTRSLVRPECFVGKSTHSLEQAKRAAEEGADYIGFGPLFATPTKPDYQPIGLHEIAAADAAVRVPIFCIGGIKLANLPHVIAAGAKRVVIVSGLLQAPHVAEYARTAKMLLTRNSKS